MLPSFLINFHKFFRFINSLNSFISRYIWNQIQHFYAICKEIKAKQVNPVSGIVLPFGGSFASPFISHTLLTSPTPSINLTHRTAWSPPQPPNLLAQPTEICGILSNPQALSQNKVNCPSPRVGIIWSSQTLHLPPQSIHHFHHPPQSLHHLHHPPPTPFLHLR